MDWRAIAREDAHRPWPRPSTPWIMTMSWVDVVFAHWSLDPDVLQAKLPKHLEVDTFEGRGWLTITPLEMRNVGPRGLSRVPWVSHFLELNVRTYVRGPDGGEGIWFFSLDASNPVAVAAARVGFHLPYVHTSLELRREESGRDGEGGWLRYESRRHGRMRFAGRFHASGPARHPQPGTLDHWLAERYRLYAADSAENIYAGDIQHLPWPLRDATGEVEINDVAASLFVDEPSEHWLAPERLHYAERRDVVGWAPRRITPRTA